MSEVSKIVLKDGVSLVSIAKFRKTYANNVSAQAINYAMDHDLLDFIDCGPRVKVIALTAKSLKYSPNASVKREKVKK